MLSLHIDILFFLGHEEREKRTGGQSDETPGSRRLTTPMKVISDEEESKIKGMEIDHPSRSRGGKKKVKGRKLEMETKKKTTRVQTLFFSSEDEEDPTSLPYY